MAIAPWTSGTAGECCDCAVVVSPCNCPECEVTVGYRESIGVGLFCGFIPFSGGVAVRYLTLTINAEAEGTSTEIGVTTTSVDKLGSAVFNYTLDASCSRVCTGSYSTTTTVDGGAPVTTGGSDCTSFDNIVFCDDPGDVNHSYFEGFCFGTPTWTNTAVSPTVRTETWADTFSDAFFVCSYEASVTKTLSNAVTVADAIDYAYDDALDGPWVGVGALADKCSTLTSTNLSLCEPTITVRLIQFRFTNADPVACPSVRITYNKVLRVGVAETITVHTVDIVAPATQTDWLELYIDPSVAFGSTYCVEAISVIPLP